MARNLMRALAMAGHDVELASDLRTYSSTPALSSIAAEAELERAMLRRQWRADRRPNMWFTYHPYYRAPDLLGPPLARALTIPYVTAEASYAGKRDRDEWRAIQETVVEAIRAAEINFCFTEADREGLARLVAEEKLADLPPFIDAPRMGRQARRLASSGPARLVTVAMMRADAKLESYRFLARALALMPRASWTLSVVGDGPAGDQVHDCFSGIDASHIHWLGELSASDVAGKLADSDVFVWPGLGEAYGLVYLEAGAAGLPIAALDTHGVPSVVRDGETGLLTPRGDAAAYAAAISRLIEEAPLRARMGAAGQAFVRNERSIEVAARRLSEAFLRLTQGAPERGLPA